MILPLLLVGPPLGFVFGLTRRLDVLTVGAAVSIVGWWILIFAVGGVAFSLGTLVLTTLAGIAYLSVGILIGWGLGAGLRFFFGMTSQR